MFPCHKEHKPESTHFTSWPLETPMEIVSTLTTMTQLQRDKKLWMAMNGVLNSYQVTTNVQVDTIYIYMIDTYETCGELLTLKYGEDCIYQPTLWFMMHPSHVPWNESLQSQAILATKTGVTAWKRIKRLAAEKTNTSHLKKTHHTWMMFKWITFFCEYVIIIELTILVS